MVDVEDKKISQAAEIACFASLPTGEQAVWIILYYNLALGHERKKNCSEQEGESAWAWAWA